MMAVFSFDNTEYEKLSLGR